MCILYSERGSQKWSEGKMAEKEAQTLQEVIKLAVDAADVATDASFEFKKINP